MPNIKCVIVFIENYKAEISNEISARNSNILHYSRNQTCINASNVHAPGVERRNIVIYVIVDVQRVSWYNNLWTKKHLSIMSF
jgi:hypothetical protein